MRFQDFLFTIAPPQWSKKQVQDFVKSLELKGNGPEGFRVGYQQALSDFENRVQKPFFNSLEDLRSAIPITSGQGIYRAGYEAAVKILKERLGA